MRSFLMTWNRSSGWLVWCPLFVAALSVGRPAGAADATTPVQWAQWRGPSGQGYSEDKQVPLTWSENDNLLWKAALPGHGNSTPVIWGERIFLTAASPDGKDRYVLCVRAGDGKILWQDLAARDSDPEKTHAWNGYASPSCATDGKYVYAFFGTPGLFCYDMDGKPIWKHTFGIFTTQTGWGTGASPFLHEDLVIQNCDNDGVTALPPGHKESEAAPSSLVALEKATGKVRWQTPRNQGRGFSTPVLVSNPGGGNLLVLNGPHGVWAYDPRSGAEIWHCERHKGEENALFGEPMPVFQDNMLYAASGRPGPLQSIRLGGHGDVTRTHLVWEASRQGSRDVASPILWDGGLYIADRTGLLSRYDLHTGKLDYRERLGTKPIVGSPVAVRDRLLFLMENGTTFVLQPGHKLQVAGRNGLHDGTEFRASPAVAEGRLYLRSQAYLYCIGEKK
jgi:outer membrane protein assembly factor BamB